MKHDITSSLSCKSCILKQKSSSLLNLVNLSWERFPLLYRRIDRVTQGTKRSPSQRFYQSPTVSPSLGTYNIINCYLPSENLWKKYLHNEKLCPCLLCPDSLLPSIVEIKYIHLQTFVSRMRIFFKSWNIFCLLLHNFSLGCETASIVMMDVHSGPHTIDHNSSSSLSKHFKFPHYIWAV